MCVGVLTTLYDSGLAPKCNIPALRTHVRSCRTMFTERKKKQDHWCVGVAVCDCRPVGSAAAQCSPSVKPPTPSFAEPPGMAKEASEPLRFDAGTIALLQEHAQQVDEQLDALMSDTIPNNMAFVEQQQASVQKLR